MKKTKNGFVRNVDDLGRIVLPMGFRKALGFEKNQTVEISVVGNAFLIRKFEQSCAFCSSTEGIKKFKGKHVCETCLNEMKKWM